MSKIKALSYIHPALVVSETSSMGRGVFTTESLPKDTWIEIAPVIVMSAKERAILDQTLLHDYIFEWGKAKKQCAMALGMIPVYNHSYEANCEYAMFFRKKTMAIRTIRKIEEGEELFINYNGQWNNKKPLWFDAK